MNTRSIAMLVLVCSALAALGGFLLADHLNHREQVAQVHHEEQRTAPNDVAPEVIPGAKPKLPAPSKPRGGKTIGTVELHIDQPPVVVPERRVGDVVCPATGVECPPLDLRIDWNQTDDGGQYVAARGPDGVELTGRYMPPAFIAAPPNKHLVVVGNPSGDVVATYLRGGRRWSWASSAGYINGEPWGGAGVWFSWR